MQRQASVWILSTHVSKLDRQARSRAHLGAEESPRAASSSRPGCSLVAASAAKFYSSVDSRSLESRHGWTDQRQVPQRCRPTRLAPSPHHPLSHLPNPTSLLPPRPCSVHVYLYLRSVPAAQPYWGASATSARDAARIGSDSETGTCLERERLSKEGRG